MRSFRSTKLLAVGLVAVLAVLLPAIVGVEEGIFEKQLGSKVNLELSTFNSGTEALTALQAGALDASYIGPSPTITAWTKLDKGVKIVSGSASGGAFFVVGQDIN